MESRQESPNSTLTSALAVHEDHYINPSMPDLPVLLAVLTYISHVHTNVILLGTMKYLELPFPLQMYV